MPSKSIHIAVNGKILSFLWLSSIPVCVCVCVYVCVCDITSSLSIHLLMDTGFFHILEILDNAAMNIGMHVCFQISVLFSLISVARSGTAGLYGSSPFSFFEKTPYCFLQ